MLRDASHHERSNRTRMHVTALGCPQHEADDAHAARGTFRNPASHFVLIVEAASQPGPHTRDSERMVIELVARDQPVTDCMRNPQRARALSSGRDDAGAGIMLQSSLRSAAILILAAGLATTSATAKPPGAPPGAPGHIPHLGRGRHLRHIQRLLSVQPLRPRAAAPRVAAPRVVPQAPKAVAPKVTSAPRRGATGAPRCATAARASFRCAGARESRGAEGTNSRRSGTERR